MKHQTDTASAALLKDHDKAIALLKSVATECDIYGEDHAWRRCRSCLAKEELDHRGVKSMLRSFLDTLASLPAPAAPEEEKPILEALIDKWNEQAATCVIRNLYDSGWVDAKGQCATDATLKMLARSRDER